MRLSGSHGGKKNREKFAGIREPPHLSRDLDPFAHAFRRAIYTLRLPAYGSRLIAVLVPPCHHRNRNRLRPFRMGGVLFEVTPAGGNSPPPRRNPVHFAEPGVSTPPTSPPPKAHPCPTPSSPHTVAPSSSYSSTAPPAPSSATPRAPASAPPLKPVIAAHTLQFTRPDRPEITFTSSTPDPTHLTLKPTGSEATIAPAMTLTLVSPPAGYPLLHRGFHWIREYPTSAKLKA